MQYTKVVEAKFGANSLELSNCYFFLATFYLETQSYHKSCVCLKQCAEIRAEKLGYLHATVSDVLINLGVVQYCRGREEKAIETLQEAGKI